MNLAINSYEYLIQMPLIPGLRTPPSQVVCELLAELQAPLANGFIGKNNTSLCHQQFNVSEAEGESKVEPYTVTYYFRWETVTRGH
jgi:hypothetical protein